MPHSERMVLVSVQCLRATKIWYRWWIASTGQSLFECPEEAMFTRSIKHSALLVLISHRDPTITHMNPECVDRLYVTQHSHILSWFSVRIRFCHTQHIEMHTLASMWGCSCGAGLWDIQYPCYQTVFERDSGKRDIGFSFVWPRQSQATVRC